MAWIKLSFVALMLMVWNADALTAKNCGKCNSCSIPTGLMVSGTDSGSIHSASVRATMP